MLSGLPILNTVNSLSIPPELSRKFVTLDASIQETLKTLVAIPSQGGIDSPDAIIKETQKVASLLNLKPELIYFDKQPVGILVKICGKQSGPHYCLTACLDTAPVGDRAAWSLDPYSAAIQDQWLYGRGCADSKAAASVFLHLMSALIGSQQDLRGTVSLFLDAHEHSGAFAGIKGLLSTVEHIDGVLIGYPGDTSIGIGARGFFRADFAVRGLQAHTGATSNQGINAITECYQFIDRLKSAIECNIPGSAFNLTKIQGGNSYSVIPDYCDASVDIRIPPGVSQTVVEVLIREQLRLFDSQRAVSQTGFNPKEAWDGYKLPDSSPLRLAFERSARQAGFDIPSRVVGPSNVGNLLANRGIEATCGFGPRYEGLHAANERVDTTTLIPTGLVYLETIVSLLRD